MNLQKPDKQDINSDLFYSINIPMARHRVLRDEKGLPVDFIWTEVNDSFIQFFNKTADDFIGKKASKFYPDELKSWKSHYREKDGVCVEVKGKSFHRSNDRYVEYRYFSEEEDHFTVLFIDISDQEKTSIELKDSQKLLRNILSTIPMRIFWKDIDSVFLGGNSAFANDAGVKEPEELIGKTDFDFAWTKEEAEAFRKDDHEVMSSKIPKLFFEEPQTHVDGKCVWLKTSKIPLLDDNGDVQGMLGFYEDITAQKEAALSLQKSEQHLRTTLHSIGDGVIDTDTKGRIRAMNPVAVKLTGVSEKEAAGKEIEDVFSIMDALTEEPLQDPVTQLLSSESSEYADKQVILRSKRGEQYHISYTATQIKNSDDSILGIVLVFRDATEKYISRRKLEFTNHTLEQARTAILWVNSAGKFIYTNPTFQKWLQYSKEELENMIVPDIDPIFTKEKWPGHWKELREAKSLRIETIQRRKNGELFPVELHLNYVLFEGDEYNLAFAYDLTEKKKAEAKLKEHENKLDLLFNAMTDVVTIQELVRDKTGNPINFKIIDCNKGFEQLTGLKRENVLGKLVTDVYNLQIPPFFKEFLKALNSGQTYEFMTYRGQLDKHFKIQIVPVTELQVAVVTTDFSDIKQIEQVLRNKNKELENYLYVASHDMRSPLVNIQGFSQRLQKQINAMSDLLNTETDIQQMKHSISKNFQTDIPKTLDFIYTNVDKMNTLIDGLLKISRTGRAIMEIRKVNMNILLETILKSFNYQFVKEDVDVTIADLPDCYGDEQLLNSLFSNLISNCYKYRDRNRKLSIQIEGSTYQNRAMYSLKDNGIGISDRHLDKIWDVFYRIDPNSYGEGEGLGLSIVKRIVDKHKGDISVESVEGVGSTFYITLPIKTFTE